MSRTGPPAKNTALLATILALLFVGSACTGDGRDLRDTQAWQTTTTRPTPATSAPDQEIAPSGFQLSSPAFPPGGQLPESATCAGGNTFPELLWSEVPPLGIELVLTLSDQTDPTQPVLLWQLAGIEPNLGRLEAGEVPVGAFETLNGFGNPGFGLPCLETMADGTRDLQFRMYVLAVPSGIAPGGDGDQAWQRVKAAALESASLLVRVDNP